MQITIAGHHVEITEALRGYVTSKLEKLERHFDQVSNIDVILSVEKLVQKAEATVPVNGQNLFANAEDQDMYAAIDALVDKLDRQIIKRKEKVTDHHRGEGSNKRAEI
jgi:putative sigma-54 modulation protein